MKQNNMKHLKMFENFEEDDRSLESLGLSRWIEELKNVDEADLQNSLQDSISNDGTMYIDESGSLPVIYLPWFTGWIVKIEFVDDTTVKAYSYSPHSTNDPSLNGNGLIDITKKYIGSWTAQEFVTGDQTWGGSNNPSGIDYETNPNSEF